LQKKRNELYQAKHAGTFFYARIVFDDIFKACTGKDLGFPELFEDYEKYHQQINTGKISRFDLVEQWLENGSNVLDVGIGDGSVAEHMMIRKQMKVCGLDISRIACEKARLKGIDAQVYDLNKGLGLQGNVSYDYIHLSEVLEHLVYPQRILLEATRHAKKGVVVTLPNSGYIKWRIHLIRGYVPRQSFTHLHMWSIKDFEIFCNNLDIKILAFRTFLPKFLLRFRNLIAYQQCWLLAPFNQ
jgi:methionine biosynthesis protein MetW